MYKKLPPSLIDNTDNIACPTKSDKLFYVHINNRLNILQNDFLLEQVSTRECHSSGQQLLDTARQILATVVILWVQRDRLVEYQNNFTWFVSAGHHTLATYRRTDRISDYVLWCSLQWCPLH